MAQSKDSLPLKNEKISTYKKRFATPYEAAEVVLVQDVIDSGETRSKFIQALEILNINNSHLQLKSMGISHYEETNKKDDLNGE